jgi:hypothetical protein
VWDRFLPTAATAPDRRIFFLLQTHSSKTFLEQNDLKRKHLYFFRFSGIFYMKLVKIRKVGGGVHTILFTYFLSYLNFIRYFFNSTSILLSK